MESVRFVEWRNKIAQLNEDVKEIDQIGKEIEERLTTFKRSEWKNSHDEDDMQQEDRLQVLRSQLFFILKSFAAMSADKIDVGLRPSIEEAHQGLTLGQQLCQEMMDIALKLFDTLKKQ